MSDSLKFKGVIDLIEEVYYRYADDVHYIGGCMTTQNPEWAFVMFPAMARPPDPALVGDGWRDMWQLRLDAMQPWLLPWVCPVL